MIEWRQTRESGWAAKGIGMIIEDGGLFRFYPGGTKPANLSFGPFPTLLEAQAEAERWVRERDSDPEAIRLKWEQELHKNLEAMKVHGKRIAHRDLCEAACEGVKVWPGCVREMREMLEYAERIIDYFANDRRSFTGSGTPHDCLAKVSILLARLKEGEDANLL